MIGPGDVAIADLGGETRELALVVSNVRFHRASGRALVAPEFRTPTTATARPWHVQADGRTFALDSLQSVRIERLLEAVGHASRAELGLLRTVLLRIV